MSEDIRKGLASVVVDETAISKVNPDTNSLLYRGYPVQELAATQPFEAVAYLLWHGALPAWDELAELRADYDYDGVQTCAVDGMCGVACPVPGAGGLRSGGIQRPGGDRRAGGG